MKSFIRENDDDNLRVNVDEIASYKNFVKNPELIKDKILAIVKNDELMFYAISPSLIKNLFKGNVNTPNSQESDQKKKKHKFTDVLSEWLNQKSLLWTPRHLAEVHRRTNKDLITFFRDDFIEDITSQDILDFIRRVESRNNFDITHRLYRDIHAVMRYAISIGTITHNIAEPLRGALLPNVVVNQKTITKKELPTLLSQISLAKFSEGKIMNHAFQLLALTFLRAQELMGGVWNEVNFEEKVWIIPAERMKMRRPHAVYLTPQMITVLETIKANHFHSTYIFYDKKRDTSIKNENYNRSDWDDCFYFLKENGCRFSRFVKKFKLDLVFKLGLEF
jgi:integrase